MKSIRIDFQRIMERNPNLGSYICLAEGVKGKGYSRRSLVDSFDKCVSEVEYSKDEKKILIDYLEHLTKPPRGQPKID